MRLNKEDSSVSIVQVIDLNSAVNELHGLSSQELNKLLRDSENFTIHYVTENRSLLKIDVEKLARVLSLHLIAVVISSNRDEALFKYLLCGVRLLHSLCDLAPRHSKLEQILLDDVKVSEQLLDVVFYMLIVFAGFEQEKNSLGPMPLMHSALVSCTLHLLTVFISSQWHEIAHVLLAHPKVDIFMDAAFGAVCVAIKYLEIKLLAQHSDFGIKSSLTAEQIVYYLCHQCEASLQFLQLLCQQKLFRERLLRNKELCGKGGILRLAQAILKLNSTPYFNGSPRVVAAVSRMKSKVLSILLSLCEAENISYLDEVASSPASLELAKSVALEVLELLKTTLGSTDPRHLAASSERNYPKGLLQLNAMRLADVYSDDSNFRSYITLDFTKVLAALFLLPHGDFLSSWCSSEHPLKEEDGTTEYDSFAAAGWVIDVFSSNNSPDVTSLEFTVVPSSMLQASYAHQRTSLFVKIIANLHCFVPTICEEQERNFFLRMFMECLQKDPSDALPGFFLPGFFFNSDAPKTDTISKNLRSLLSHAESLIPNSLSEEDLQLLRVFFSQLQSLLSSAESEENQEKKYEEAVSCDKFSELNISDRHQVALKTGECPSSLLKKEPPYLNNRRSNLEEINDNSALQGVDQICVNNKYLDQEEEMTEDKGKSCKNICGSSTEIDKDPPNVETGGLRTSSTRERIAKDQIDGGELPKANMSIRETDYIKGNQEDEKVETVQCEEKQRRKRKRTIMNDQQIAMIERALLDEPEMQRHAALLQSWADKLSLHGSEVTNSQLKNWLNNRKARLARTSKDVRATSEADNSFPEKRGPGRRSNDSPESPGGDAPIQPNAYRDRRDPQSTLRTNNAESSTAEVIAVGPAQFVKCHPGQHVVLVDANGEEIGEGKVFQMHGQWYGRNLDELGIYVVDVKELKAKRGTRLPYPSVATGVSFEEAETRVGVMRVLWDSSKIFLLQPK